MADFSKMSDADLEALVGGKSAPQADFTKMSDAQLLAIAEGKHPTGDGPPEYDLKKWAGLTARNAIQGAAALPATLIANPVSAIYNAGADLIQGKGKGARLNEANANIYNALTNLGFPTPDTPGERVGSAIQQGVAGAGTGISLGRLLMGGSGPVAPNVGNTIAANPGKQLAGGALGGGASAQTREMGYSVPVQMAAGFIGGVAPFAAAPLVNFGARAVNKGVDYATNGNRYVLNPAIEAEKRLRSAFIKDGGPTTAAQNAGSFARSGASTPALIDVGGGNVRNLVRAAAGEGDEAHNLAQNYANQVRGNLQDNATAAVNRMAPGNMSAAQTEAALTQGQRELADVNYAGPYSQPATVTTEMVDALQGPTGRTAIRRALNTAEIRRDLQQMGELQDLLAVADAQSGGSNPITGRFQSLPQALEGLSAGALDRVRIAMRETGNAASMKGNNAAAGGYFGRVSDIDTALDQTPGLVPARAAYRQTQAGIDAVEQGSRILRTPSTQYAEETAALAGVGGPPNIGTGLQAGAKQSLLNDIEAPAAGQTGILNRIATSNRADDNLANTFGAERAGTFQEAITNEVQRLRNANYISPETGSQTALRQGQSDLVGGVPTTLWSFVTKVAEKVFGGIPLTAAERAEIVRLGVSEADLMRFASPRVAARPAVSAAQTVINSGAAQPKNNALATELMRGGSVNPGATALPRDLMLGTLLSQSGNRPPR